MLVRPFSSPRADDSSRAMTALPLTLAVLVVAALFAAAPWSLEQKAHAALHGLCTQRPSHSMVLGGQTLPFDARMTGIYAGFLVSGLYLTARGRLHAQRLPSLPTLVLGALFVGSMAVDGLNSLLMDAGTRSLYPPANSLRLMTGLLTGTVLAPIVVYLLASTLWRPGRDRRPVMAGGTDLLVIVAWQIPLALLLHTGSGWLFTPMTLLLLAAALIMITAVMLVLIVLVWHGDGAFTDPRQVQLPALLAFGLAIAVLGVLGGGRFLLERLMGAPALI